jgi:DNA-binding XRE family transcriptional regulator
MIKNNRLSELRNEVNLKQEELAAAISTPQYPVDKSTIGRYERGSKLANIELENKLCDYFNCSLDYLRCRTNVRNEAKYSATLKKVSAMIVDFYAGSIKNEQDLSDEQLAHFEDFILQFKELFQKLSNSRYHYQK